MASLADNGIEDAQLLRDSSVQDLGLALAGGTPAPTGWKRKAIAATVFFSLALGLLLGTCMARQSLRGTAGSTGSVDHATQEWSPAPVTLFCFLVATHASAGEVELVRHQYVNNLGVFACDNARAYADEEAIALAPEQNNTPFFISHAAPRSALGNKGWLLNVDTFQKVWDIIKADGLYAKYDVTVKVDPDTVFLPAKLKTKLQWNNPAEPWYVANCGQWGSMQGPLEIVSKAGVDKLTSGFGGCRQSINDGFSYWKWGSLPGEDMFVAECLDQLGVRKVQMFDVLADTNCGFNPAQGCHNTGNVCAFHKFKEPTQWSQCLDQLAK